jgi:hypothetical protein
MNASNLAVKSVKPCANLGRKSLPVVASVRNDDSNGTIDAFLHDRLDHTTVRISVRSDGGQGLGDTSSTTSSVSADGRFVVFDSAASDLVVGDVNASFDVFLRDVGTG